VARGGVARARAVWDAAEGLKGRSKLEGSFYGYCLCTRGLCSAGAAARGGVARARGGWGAADGLKGRSEKRAAATWTLKDTK